MLHLSELHERMHNWKLARADAERALKLAKETGLKHLRSDAADRLMSIEANPDGSRDRRLCFHGIVYASEQMRSLISRLKLVAATDEAVLISGETGAGKDLIARAIHLESKRRAHPFVPFNCSALTRELIESRLFGHRRGAFSGAISDEPGVIRSATGGTVFLDEIGDLTLGAQGALLRFLDSGEVQPLDSPRPIKADVRVACATNRDLREEVRAGRFRQDLYYRLNVATLYVPPLWQRPEDVKELARHFIRVYSEKFEKPEPVFLPDEIERLVEPGNVRELENYIKRRVIFGDTELAKNGLLDAEPSGVQGAVFWRDLSESEKRSLLLGAMERCRGNVTAAANLLGISRRTVQRLCSKA